MLEKFVEKYGDCGYERGRDENWVKTVNTNNHRVKMDLFRRFKYIAAAGEGAAAESRHGKVLRVASN